MTAIRRAFGLRWFVLFFLMGAVMPAHAGRRHDQWASAVTAEETIEKTFSVSASGQASLDLDNFYGSIEVVGTSGGQIEVSIAKSLRAASPSELELAKTEVTLNVSQDGDNVRFYVDGPFRCYDDYPDCWRRRKERHYVVKMDFKIRVPERIALKLRTVSEGTVTVDNVLGDYDVRNVNGAITMRDVGGSGNVQTVNGAVKVTFRENPREASEFSTVNGDVELVFPKTPSADFRFKTMSGAVYTDFRMTALPPAAAKAERKDGVFVYHADGYTGGRVGSGGPEIKLENLNGQLRVLGRES